MPTTNPLKWTLEDGYLAVRILLGSLATSNHRSKAREPLVHYRKDIAFLLRAFDPKAAMREEWIWGANCINSKQTKLPTYDWCALKCWPRPHGRPKSHCPRYVHRSPQQSLAVHVPTVMIVRWLWHSRLLYFYSNRPREANVLPAKNQCICSLDMFHQKK